MFSTADSHIYLLEIALFFMQKFNYILYPYCYEKIKC